VLNGKKILVAVCGSIAAYKTAYLIRLLVKQGADVRVIMTPAAKEFISPLTLATLSKHECYIDYTNTAKTNWNNHVDLALWADVMLVAPASASTISKMANGICDNLLMGAYLSMRNPVLLAPAMDEDMWKHSSTRSNLQKLKSFGNAVIPVNSGELASGLHGEGRMAEPGQIMACLEEFFYTRLLDTNELHSKLAGRRVLITAGPTYEALDPIRFLGNHSSGKMGIALAEKAYRLGAHVKLVLGPSKLSPLSGIDVTRVFSANEMYAACKKNFANADVCIFAAAVADFTPKTVSRQKIKKTDKEFTLTLKKNIDIAEEFGKVKQKGLLSIGFALETNDELKHAREKLKKKNFDLVVLNSLNEKGAGFQFNTNKITIVNRNNKILKFELKKKEEVAQDILASIENLLK
jgi:phosphopantothenoylcysteine decarboxylase/phosphopantothenate--cysteine ligase